MNILVTGGAGFIGSNIVDAYLEAGHAVVALDDLSTGKRKNVNEKAVFVEMDVRNPELMDVFNQYDINFVNHQAARGDVRASLQIPEEYADVNIRGGVNLLECSRKKGVKGIIYSSTGGCVYGEPLYTPTKEDHPMQPRDPYGASKSCFEIYLKMYKEFYDLPYTIFRYPNVYGVRQNPFGEAGVVSIFAKKMLDNAEVVINGNGEQLRDFVFVGDVVRANLLATENTDNEIYNLGTEKGVSVNTIFEELKKITGYEKEAKYGPAKLGEVSCSILSADKIKEGLGWSTQTDLTTGLTKTVDFIRTQTN